MTDKIMQDNFLYLQEWKKYNPGFQDTLFIEENYLICKNEKESDVNKVDISHFYLPDLLYNSLLRESLTDDTLRPQDLFEIIRLYVETEEMNQKEQKKISKYPKIKNILLQKDEKEKIFLLIIDEFDKKYRYDTENPQKVLQLFGLLKAKNPDVTLEEFGKELQNVK